MNISVTNNIIRFVLSILSKSCKRCSYRLTRQRYDKNLNIQTFLDFVCKCLKMNILQKQNFSYLYTHKNRHILTRQNTCLMLVLNMPLFGILRGFLDTLIVFMYIISTHTQKRQNKPYF